MNDVLKKRLLANSWLRYKQLAFQNYFRYHSFVKTIITNVSVHQKSWDQAINRKSNITKAQYKSELNTTMMYFKPLFSFSTNSCQVHRDYSKGQLGGIACKKCNRSWNNKLNFICGKWHYLKDPEILSSICYFELFGIDVDFNINKKDLEQNFYKLQFLFHPDRYVNKSDQELVDSSTAYSSFINNGYKILSDDLERAKYILKLKGYDVLTEDESISDLEFLEFIMETREEIENVDSKMDLEIHKSHIDEKREELIQQISSLFSDDMYEDIRKLVIKLKYYNRILEAIDIKSRELI